MTQKNLIYCHKQNPSLFAVNEDLISEEGVEGSNIFLAKANANKNNCHLMTKIKRH